MFARQLCSHKRKPMVFTKKDYLQLDRTWKAKPVAFKAHPETKATVQEIQRQQNFKTEGETLDFILQHYLHTTKATPATENQPTEPVADVSAFAEHEQKLKKEIFDLKSQILYLKTDLEDTKVENATAFDRGFDAALSTTDIETLTANLNEWFPKYFAPVIDGKKLEKIRPVHAVNLAVAYALEDKKEGFPYDHHSRPLLDQLLISDSE